MVPASAALWFSVPGRQAGETVWVCAPERLPVPSTIATTTHAATMTGNASKPYLLMPAGRPYLDARVTGLKVGATIPGSTPRVPPQDREPRTILTNFFAGAGRSTIAYPVLVRRGTALLLTAATALLASAASALGGSGDVAATEKYIRANYALVQAGRAKLGAAAAALAAVKHQIARDCPRAAAESPQNEDSTQLSNEIIGAMVLNAYRTGEPAGQRFISAVKGLRWSNRRLTNTIQAYASKLKVLKALAPPDVCADVRAWVASNYKTLPATTVGFDQQFMPNWVAIGELPALLAPYERPSQKSILRRTHQLEVQLDRFRSQRWGRNLGRHHRTASCSTPSRGQPLRARLMRRLAGDGTACRAARAQVRRRRPPHPPRGRR